MVLYQMPAQPTNTDNNSWQKTAIVRDLDQSQYVRTSFDLYKYQGPKPYRYDSNP